MSLRRIASAALAVAALATIAAPAASAATTTTKKTTTTPKTKTTTTAAATGPAAAGQKVFETQCVICHSISGKGGVVGPDLTGVVGRKVATVPGFAYSKAMKAKSHLWTKGNLDIYLTDPQKFVPGSAMPINVPDAKVRSDVIAYLSTTK
jgi:cytochrome c